MNFSSSLFLLYFLPAFLVVYFLLSNRLRNLYIMAGSVFFFFWGAPLFTFILIGSILVNYYLSLVIDTSEGRSKRIMLIFLLVFNLALLFYYKYTGFFISQLNGLISLVGLPEIPLMHILLPIGISFITFQQISYVLDVFRGTCKPSERLSDYALFVFFFPKILAGPIVRYKEFSLRIISRAEFSGLEERLTGFFRFSLGLAKKVIIANTLGAYANEIFAIEPFQITSQMAWLGALAYSFQIYFDFSAYSDMAIGLARMLGFNIPENFNNPYVSVGIIEFWKRWHITLGTWLRDYLFLPLAYSLSRKMPKNRYLGLKTDLWLYVFSSLITMIICGFWHGAGWTFILWGLYHGLFMALEKLFLLKLLKKTGRVFAALFTFFIVTLGWILFRSATMDEAIEFYKIMFSFSGYNIHYIIQPQLLILLVMAAVFSFWAIIRGVEKWQMQLYTGIKSTEGLIAITVAGMFLFIIGLSQVTAAGFNPFIYFRF